jgi:hypothetical protein
MGNDRDRSGAADSRGESAGEPDEFDSLVLDEDFISAGIPEASLPSYQRSIPRPGSTDDAQRQRRRRSSSAFETSADPESWPPVSHHTRRQRRTTGILLAAAAVLVVGVVLSAFLHLRTGLGGAGGAGNAAANLRHDAGADAVRQQIAGLAPAAPDGTCFDAQTVSTSTLIQVEPCSQEHRYELIGVVEATGRSDQYPAAGYWSGPVDDQCATDLTSVTGKTPSDWPAGLHLGSLLPTRADWASGDRTVYCIADSQKAVSGSLHQLNAAAAAPTA